MTKLKRFKCFILNDRDSDTGWYSFINSFLIAKRYLERCAIESACNGKAIEFTIYSPQSPTNPGSTFSEALAHLRSRAKEYDLFVIDLDLSDGDFINENEFLKVPSASELPDKISNYLTDGEEDTLRVWRHLTSCKQKGLKSGFYAGLECFRELGYGDSLKVVFSGSDQTKQLFEYVGILKNIFSSRLSDIIFYRDGEFEEDKDGVEELLDAYLFKRQIKIIERQDPSLRDKLRVAVGHSQWDERLIPENGESKNCEEYWSLRSLFPKQVNSITRGFKEDESRHYIATVLDADWRQQFRELVNHPYKDSSSERRCSSNVKILGALEFDIASEKAFDYHRLTESYAFSMCPPFKSLNQLRDEIVHSNISFFSKNTAVYSRSDDLFQLMDLSYWQNHLSDYATNFGIFPEDLKYLAQIAEHNKRHLLVHSEGVNAHDVDLYLKVEDDSDEHDGIANHLTFTWCYSKQADPEKLSNPRLHEKFSSARQNPYVLEDGGIGDAIRIVCFRYRGTLELQSGKERLTISRNSFMLTPIESDSFGFDGITQLRAIISKPHRYPNQV